MYNHSKWKQLGIIVILLFFAGFMAACGGDNEPGVNDNTIDNGIEPTQDGGLVEPTAMIDEPTPTAMVLETDVMEPTMMPTEMMEETAVPTEEMEPTMEPTVEMTATAEITGTQESTAPMDQPAIVRGSDLIGAELMTMTDEAIAEVEEILFDANGDIQYAILSVAEMTDEFPYYAVA